MLGRYSNISTQFKNRLGCRHITFSSSWRLCICFLFKNWVEWPKKTHTAVHSIFKDYQSALTYIMCFLALIRNILFGDNMGPWSEESRYFFGHMPNYYAVRSSNLEVLS